MLDKNEWRERLQGEIIAEIERLKSAVADTEISAVATAVDSLARLAEGGKYNRAYLHYLAEVTASNVPDENINWKRLVAIELFQLFALIHDDIADRADERRAVPTIHANLHQTHYPADDYLSKMQAMLLGDLLLAHVFALLQSEGESYMSVFDLMIKEVSVGQMIDLDMSQHEEPSRKLLEKKTLLKSALYSFQKPIELGYTAVGTELPDAARSFGKNLGMAYQIVDDVRDLYADQTSLKRAPGLDIIDGQQTYLTLLAYETNATLYETLRSKRGSTLTEANIAELRTLIKEAGVFQKIEQEFTAYIEAAAADIEEFATPETKEHWEKMLESITNHFPATTN